MQEGVAIVRRAFPWHSFQLCGRQSGRRLAEVSGTVVTGVPGASGRGGPPTTIPPGSFSTILGLHGPESNMSAITAITTTAAIIGQLILLILVLPWPEILTRLNVTSRKTTSIQRDVDRSYRFFRRSTAFPASSAARAALSVLVDRTRGWSDGLGKPSSTSRRMASERPVNAVR